MAVTFGLGAVLCAACCALPLIGLLGSAATLGVAYLSGGLECLLMAFLGLAGLGVWMVRRRKARSAACVTSCEMGCGCASQAEG